MTLFRTYRIRSSISSGSEYPSNVLCEKLLKEKQNTSMPECRLGRNAPLCFSRVGDITCYYKSHYNLL